MKFPFIRYTKVWLTIASATVVICLAMVIGWGLKPGIDFTGGSLMELTFSKNRPDVAPMQKVFEDLGQKDAIIQKSGDSKMLVRTGFLQEEQHQKALKAVKDTFEKDGTTVREDSFETIGAVVSQQLRQRSIWAISLVCISIILYLAYAFRKVSKPIASWKYGLLAVVALVHDVILVLGVFAALGHFFGVEVDIAFVVAILTVLGYSVNDTIVVYDRIRENLQRHSSPDFSEVVNNGLNETLARSINTTLTVLLPLFALFFIGGPTIHNFALALLIGMASGAYSSIFIASPLLVVADRLQRRA